MTTLNLQVEASTDDACEDGSNGNVDDTNSNVYLTSANWWGGFRWADVTIPDGATVDSAIPQVYVSSVDYDDIEVDIYGQNVADASTFTGGAGTYDISGRTRTTASVNKSASGVGVGWYSLPDCKTVVQEIVDDQSGLSSAGLVLIEDGLSGVNLTQRSYDYSDGSLAAKFDIDYTAAGGQPAQLRGTTVKWLRQWQPGRM